MRILALSGSLRAASINSALLRTVARLAPADIEVVVYGGLGALALFNPDIEAAPPAPVADFIAHVGAADALMIASPEYAHGVTGTIKNALDWLVGLEDFAGTPVAVLNASQRAHHADDAIKEILRTMATDVVEAASPTLPLLGSGLTETDMADDPAIAAAIGQCFDALRDAVQARPPTR